MLTMALASQAEQPNLLTQLPAGVSGVSVRAQADLISMGSIGLPEADRWIVERIQRGHDKLSWWVPWPLPHLPAPQ